VSKLISKISFNSFNTSTRLFHQFLHNTIPSAAPKYRSQDKVKKVKTIEDVNVRENFMDILDNVTRPPTTKLNGLSDPHLNKNKSLWRLFPKFDRHFSAEEKYEERFINKSFVRQY